MTKIGKSDFQGYCSKCSHLPCQNGGTCVDLPNFQHQCQCLTGFYGENCEFTGLENASLPDGRRLSTASCNATEVTAQYPSGKYWCKCRNGTEVSIRSNLMSIIKSWGVFFNYVTNFNYSYTDITCADAGMNVKTPTSRVPFTTSLRTKSASTSGAFNILHQASTNIVYIEQSYWGSGFGRIPPFYIMVSGLAGIERMLVTALQVPDPSTTDSFILEVQRGLDGSRLKFDLEEYGDLPAAPSSKWICHARLYNDGRQCDCRCGMPDPDCLFPNLPVRNCGRGEACSTMGRCTTAEASAGLSDTTQVYVSEACTQLYLRGHTDLAGYMGTEEEYREISGGGCPTCPFEPGNLYGGAASLSEACDDDGNCVQEYMCRYKAEGVVDSRLVREFDNYLADVGELFDEQKKGFYTLQGGTVNASNAYRLVVVKLGSRSPFPYGSEIPTYKLDINQDCGGVACANKEIIEASGARTTRAGEGSLAPRPRA
eukprot:s929_g13.t1